VGILRFQKTNKEKIPSKIQDFRTKALNIPLCDDFCRMRKQFCGWYT